MKYDTNIANFLGGTSATSPTLLRAYCGLVTLELILNRIAGTNTHNVPASLSSFIIGNAIGAKAGFAQPLNSLRMQLISKLTAIHSQNRNGLSHYVPANSYPHIRYTRFVGDGWGTHETPQAHVLSLVATVDQIRNSLKNNFGLPL